MAKQNGMIRLGGTLHVAGPDIIERLARGEEIEFDEPGAKEFFLKVSKADADKIVSFDPLVWVNKADVEIHTDARDDDMIGEDLAIYFKGEFDRSIALDLSVAQAEALIEILSNFVKMFRAKEELDKTFYFNAA